jgi:hypothetical protein
MVPILAGNATGVGEHEADGQKGEDKFQRWQRRNSMCGEGTLTSAQLLNGALGSEITYHHFHSSQNLLENLFEFRKYSRLGISRFFHCGAAGESALIWTRMVSASAALP